MNIKFKTTAEIEAHAEKVLGLFNTTGKQLYKDIYDACQNELRRRVEKKSEPAQTESKATPEKIEKAKEAKRIFEEQVGGLLSKSQPVPKTESTFMRVAGVVASVVAPEPVEDENTISIEYPDGTVESFTFRKLTSKNQQYFLQLFDSKRFKDIRQNPNAGRQEIETLLKEVRKLRQYYRLFARCVAWKNHMGRMMTIKELQAGHNAMSANNKASALILYDMLCADVNIVK